MPDSMYTRASALVGRRILVVEDHFLIAMDIEAMIQAAGGTVEIVNGADAAVLAIARARPDAVVLDVNLGADSSLPVARQLQAHAIPYLLSTGYADRAETLAGFGPVPVLTKPCRGTDLIEALVGLLPSA